MKRFLATASSALFMAGMPAAAEDTLTPFAPTPFTPAVEAAQTFESLDGFEMQLIAAEPLVTDPVAIAYDEFGRAYVAEMNDYPYTDKARHKPAQENPTDAAIGKVRLLEDTDDDGKFDKSTVFAEDLSWPTGVACWKGGVYVTATPDLWYFKDTDGDGVADVRRKVYTGFRKYNVQAVVNNPVWGLDHRIHISGSTNGGKMMKPDAPQAEPIVFSRHDLRFDPVSETLALESGYGRFGNTFDDFGNRFICNIRNPALHMVVPHRYLVRNPFLPPQRGIQDIGQFGDFLPVHRISPPEAWRVERAARWAREEPDRHPPTELVGAGAVTSSAGITVYRGDAYPERYRGQLFVADVSSNLFYRLALESKGVTFKATRLDAEADFVASRDVWFRPVNLVNAPDGCLHVLDMYREAIEHPWSIPDDLHARIDLRRGLDRGRIYRLSPPNFKPRPTPRIGDLSTAALVSLLEHPNAWHRETAHRLLFEREDATSAAPLRKLRAEAENPVTRIHALWSLAGLGMPMGPELLPSLQDPSPAVREHAVIIADSPAFTGGAVAEAVAAALHDPDARVRFRALLAAPRLDPARVRADLLSIARNDGPDSWMQSALLTSTTDTAGALLVALLAPAEKIPAPSLLRDLAYTVGAKNDPDEVRRVIQSLTRTQSALPESRIPVAAGIADGLKRARQNLFRVAADQGVPAGFREATLRDARALAADSTRSLQLRSLALTLFKSASLDEAVAVYAALLTPETPPDLQSVSIQSLSAFADPRIPEILLDAWPRLSPRVRQPVLDALLARPERLEALLDAIGAGTVSAHLLTRARRDFLTSHADKTVAEKAKTLFETGTRPRAQIIDQYREAAGRAPGDATAGKEVFQTACIACHRAGEDGFSDLGPNLSTIRQWDREQLLVNILDPNREISPAFIEYVIEKKDGGVVTGAVLNETESAVLLRLTDGTRKSVYRRDIQSMKNTGLSLMPEGLEAVITPAQMADLIAYLTRP